MAFIQIPNLPAVIGLAGDELFEGVQAGTSVKISLQQIIAAVRFDTSFTIPILVSEGGTGVTTLTGYVKGSGTSPFTASATIPNTDITGLGTMSVQNADAVAITGGTAALTGASSVTANSGAAALTITQTGAGNSFIVEDSTNPDSSPFVVDQVGNVGIGASTGLTKKLNLASDASYDAATRMTNSANTLGFEVGLLAGNADATAYVYQRANSPMLFGTNNLTRMTIDATGNVGIGVTPTQTLDVNGAINMRGDGSQVAAFLTASTALRQTGSAGTFYFDVGSSGSSGQFVFRSSSVFTERFRIGSSGQFGIGGTNYGTAGQTIISAGAAAAPAWGAVGASGGGTGITTYAIGDILFASGTTTLSKLADVATGNALISGGVGVAPSYGKIGLTTHVSGTLPAANGGTGVTTAPAEAARILGFTSTATAAGTTVLTNTSTQYQLFTGVTTQTITLPVTSTLGTGWSFHIVNNSTGTLTVNSSGGNLVTTVIAGLSSMVTCIGTTLTTAADWEAGFTDFQSITGTGANVLASSPAITGGSIDNMTVGATTQASVRGTSLVSNSVITDGFITHANGTLALAFATDGVCQVTPTATGTFTTTVPAAGTRCTLIILTSGTSSFTMTFGTGFKTTGTLATGTTSARYFIFQFISDGTSVIEASRTVAIA